MKSIIFKNLLISVFIISTFHCFARAKQDTAEPCERFIITREDGTKLTDTFWYVYNQQREFLNRADTAGALFCIKRESMEDLFSAMETGNTGLVNGFRIYLALDKDAPAHPKLKLVFAAINGFNDIDGRYFTIKNDSSIGIITKPADISKLRTEITAYQTDILPFTSSKLGCNGCNTKSYMYNRGLLPLIRRQIARQAGNSKVYAVKFELGAYSTMNSEHKKYQMLIGFSMIDSNGVEFFENEYPMDENFGCKISNTASASKFIMDSFPAINKKNPAEKKKIIEKLLAVFKSTGDTGVPCPPNTTGCSSAKLP